MSLFRIQQDSIIPIIVASILVAVIISCALLSMGLITVKTATAQVNSTNYPTITPSSHNDSSPVVAVFVITKDNQGNLIFLPNSATIKPGEEILVLNNATKLQTVLNGKGPDDPLSGRLFSIGAIKPKAFRERDILSRLVSENKGPFKVTLKDIMSSPLITIAEEESVKDAVLLMRSKHIRRLVVKNAGDSNNITGTITLMSIVGNRLSFDWQ